MVTVRPATVADALAMGRASVRAWRAAYRGHMPDDYLDGLRPDQRAAFWESALGRDDGRGAILVAEHAGEVVGFATLGPHHPGARRARPRGPLPSSPARGAKRTLTGRRPVDRCLRPDAGPGG